jgi:hypothetical protein
LIFHKLIFITRYNIGIKYMILNQNIAASWSFNNDKDITLSIYFMNAYECNAHDFCLHTSKGMKPHRTPPRAMYDAMLYRYSRTIGHDMTSYVDES